MGLIGKTILKMTKETNKGDFKSLCAKLTKPTSKKAAKAEVEQLIMDCFDCIFISTNNSAYLIPMPIFSLV